MLICVSFQAPCGHRGWTWAVGGMFSEASTKHVQWRIQQKRVQLHQWRVQLRIHHKRFNSTTASVFSEACKWFFSTTRMPGATHLSRQGPSRRMSGTLSSLLAPGTTIGLVARPLVRKGISSGTGPSLHWYLQGTDRLHHCTALVLPGSDTSIASGRTFRGGALVLHGIGSLKALVASCIVPR